MASSRRKANGYKHWLSAGAVTIGMGAAVATGHGVAAADPKPDDPSASSSEDSGPAPSSRAETGAPAERKSSDPSGPKRAKRPESKVAAQTVTSKDEGSDAAGAGDDEQTRHAAPDRRPEAKAKTKRERTVEPPESTVPVSDKGGSHDDSQPDESVVALTSTTNDVDQQSLSDVGKIDGPTTVADPVRAPIPRPALPPVEALWLATRRVDDPTPHVAASTTPVGDDVTRTVVTTSEARDDAQVFAAAPITLRSIVTDVLTWVGLGPLAAAVPVPALPVGPITRSIWQSVRDVAYVANNQLPVARPTIIKRNVYTGRTEGSVGATDYEDDAITYTLVRPPADGTFVFHDDGTYTYLPSTGLATAGGRVTFEVTLDDAVGNPPHLHGLLGLFGTHRRTVTVTIDVPPVDQTPNNLVRQAHTDFSASAAKKAEANRLTGLADSEATTASQLRSAAAAILANNPDPQMQLDAQELIRRAEGHEQAAAQYRSDAATQRTAADALGVSGWTRIDEARALNPDVEVGDLPTRV